MLCVGAPFDKKEKSYFKELCIHRQVFQKDSTDEEMAFMYKKALAFVYPSLYEGFGMPILEAFSCECPVLLSNIKVFKEVAGEAAIYFDPNDNDSICDALNTVINDDRHRSELILKGNKRLIFFSWSETFNLTKKVYEAI